MPGELPMLRNSPGELLFLVPGPAFGSYRPEVHSLIRVTPEIRTGILPGELWVSAKQ